MEPNRTPYVLVMRDSLASCEYLAETFAAVRLWPEDTAARGGALRHRRARFVKGGAVPAGIPEVGRGRAA
jgi:glutathione S-transferase